MKSVPLVGLWTSPIMKKPSFRVSLLYNINKYKNGHRDWFNKITDQILLGLDAQNPMQLVFSRNFIYVTEIEHSRCNSTET